MIDTIYLATNNQNKIRELCPLFENYCEKIIPQCFFGIEEADEPYDSYEENALAKAEHLFKHFYLDKKLIPNSVIVADDCGLEVNALNGEPGVFSKRFASNAEERVTKLLSLLSGNIVNRRGIFVCNLALLFADGKSFSFRGESRGYILEESAGNGFGFESVFSIYGLNGPSVAQMSLEKKNKLCHRGLAAQKMIDFLRNKHLAVK